MKSAFVVIVDDDVVLCSSLVDLVRSVGCDAVSFHSAEDFLAVASSSRFDCVVVDVQMPGMGGLDLVRRLKEQGGMLPVILITALPDTRLDEVADALGMQCLLRKPFEAEALLTAIEHSLGQDAQSR